MGHYSFRCAHCQTKFEKDAATQSFAHSLLPSLLTMGLSRLFLLYSKSQCPKCGKRSFFLLFIALFLLLLTMEFCREIYYFVEVAPQQIVRDASMAELPEDVDLNAEISRENLPGLLHFIWAVGAMPIVGAYISMNWPYMLLIAYTIVTLIAMSIPSFYLKREET